MLSFISELSISHSLILDVLCVLLGIGGLSYNSKISAFLLKITKNDNSLGRFYHENFIKVNLIVIAVAVLILGIVSLLNEILITVK
jgi:hypothetical protein